MIKCVYPLPACAAQAGHHHEHNDHDIDATIDEYHDEDAEHEEFLHEAGVDEPGERVELVDLRLQSCESVDCGLLNP